MVTVLCSDHATTNRGYKTMQSKQVCKGALHIFDPLVSLNSFLQGHFLHVNYNEYIIHLLGDFRQIEVTRLWTFNILCQCKLKPEWQRFNVSVACWRNNSSHQKISNIFLNIPTNVKMYPIPPTQVRVICTIKWGGSGCTSLPAHINTSTHQPHTVPW